MNYLGAMKDHRRRINRDPHGRKFPAGVALVLSVLLLSCGDTHISPEKSRSGTTIRLTGIYVDFNRQIGGTYGQVEFGAERATARTTGVISYALTVAPLVIGGLSVRDGDTLLLMIDTDTTAVRCSRVVEAKRGLRRGNPATGRGLYYLETLRFAVDRSLLQALAFAGEVRYEIFGREKSLPGSFTDGNIAAFREFYRQHLH